MATTSAKSAMDIAGNLILYRALPSTDFRFSASLGSKSFFLHSACAHKFAAGTDRLIYLVCAKTESGDRETLFL